MAEIVAVVAVVTAVVLTVKLALVAPAATVTLLPTCAVGLLLVSVTTTPPAGARPLKVTVPVEELPPTTVVGFRDRADRVGGLMVSCAVRAVPLKLPEMVATVLLATGSVVMVKLALRAPAATVTVAGG